MPEHTDYFDPFVVEMELPPGREYDPFVGGQSNGIGLCPLGTVDRCSEALLESRQRDLRGMEYASGGPEPVP